MSCPDQSVPSCAAVVIAAAVNVMFSRGSKKYAGLKADEDKKKSKKDEHSTDLQQ